VADGANALTVTVTDVSANIATQVVNFTVAGTQPIGYDGNGNQTNENGWAFAYDRENRLVSATSASLAVNYSYDALGRLIQRIAGNSTNWMYYAGWQLIAEYNGASVLQRKYVFGPGIDEPIRMTAGTTNYYYHADGLGSVTEITDSSGLQAESYNYDVYGTSAIYNGNGVVTNASGIGNRLMFTGRDCDKNTGWYNYRYRYYNADLGRFVQTDPISLNGGDHNLYRYCLSDPVNLIDPLGLTDLTLFDCESPGGRSGVWKVSNGDDFIRNAESLGGFPIGGKNFSDVYKEMRRISCKVGGFDSITIIGHGEPGRQALGNEVLTANSMYAKKLGGFVKPKGIIRLLGCNVAEGPLGRKYLQDLANATGRTIVGFTGKTWDATPSLDMEVVNLGNRVVASPQCPSDCTDK
jgi:RHS repeat-associated protein